MHMCLCVCQYVCKCVCMVCLLVYIFVNVHICMVVVSECVGSVLCTRVVPERLRLFE